MADIVFLGGASKQLSYRYGQEEIGKAKDSRPGQEEGVEEWQGLMYGIFNLTTNELFDKGFIGTQWEVLSF